MFLGLIIALLSVVFSIHQLSGIENRYLTFLSVYAARIFFRFTFLIFGLNFWYASQKLISSQKLNNNAIGDGLLDFLDPVNTFLHDNPSHARYLIIISSFFIDVFGLFIIDSTLFGKSIHVGISLFILFIFRQISQVLCALPAPNKMIWFDPGIPSLFVTYHVTNDFFFSGHTAVAVLGAIEVYNTFPIWISIFAVFIAIFEMFTVLAMKAHYTMDVFMAIASAFLAYSIAGCII